MTETCLDIYHDIDLLTQSNAAFALFRLPSTTEPVLMIQTGGLPVYLEDFRKLNKQTGFVFAPFQITAQCPVVLLQPDIKAYGREAISHVWEREEVNDLLAASAYTPGNNDHCRGNTYARYAKAFSDFVEPLKSRKLRKLVLSRTLTRERGKHFSPAHTFFEACEQYTTAFVYLFHSPLTGTWLGSTPEVLLANEGKRWHTMALAGTRKESGKDNNPAPKKNTSENFLPAITPIWDEKNRQEQRIVAEYIRMCLLSYGIAWEENGPRTIRAGKVSHLLTDFYFSTHSNSRLGELINLLHPTPAVCGLPQQEALRFILRHEGYERRYYTGFTGWLDPESNTSLFVNLRCMHIGANKLTLYAGGGLLASSEVNTEWKETEDKLQTLLEIINNQEESGK